MHVFVDNNSSSTTPYSPFHHNDVIMSAVASRITSVFIVCSTVHAQIKKISKLRVTGLCVGNSSVTGEFPAQKASNAENVSIWWRHHVNVTRLTNDKTMKLIICMVFQVPLMLLATRCGMCEYWCVYNALAYWLPRKFTVIHSDSQNMYRKQN